MVTNHTSRSPWSGAEHYYLVSVVTSCRMATAPLDIEGAARRAGHYKWLEMRLFEVLGDWVATVPELDVKLRLAAHCHHHAWHAELWHKRIPELQDMGPDRLTGPSNGGMVAFMDTMSEPEGPELTIEKLVGVYRVLMPHKITVYTHHLGNTSPTADAPTIRALRLILRDELDDWRDGEMLLQSLIQTPDGVDRAAAHQARLEKLLMAAGGITGHTAD